MSATMKATCPDAIRADGEDEVVGLLRALLDQLQGANGRDLAVEDTGEDVLLHIVVDGFRYKLTKTTELIQSQKMHLSPREEEIARLVAKGLPNKTIAAVLDISAWTVTTHLRRMFTKLNVHSRAEMVAAIFGNPTCRQDSVSDRNVDGGEGS